MKKIGLILLVSLMILTGCSSGPYKNVNTTQVQKMIDEKDSFILIYGSNSCEYCAQYKKTMTTIVKEYDVTIYYLEVNASNLAEVQSFINVSLNQSADNTPTTFVIVDGAVDLKQEGALESSAIEKMLLKYGYITEINSD